MRTLNVASASFIEAAIKKLVSMDPEASQKLSALNNKWIQIQLTDWQLTYTFHIHDETIDVLSHCEEDCQVTMQGTSFAFFNMANSERGGDAIFKGEVHFSGEISTAQAFQSFWQELDIDWEEELSKYTGDIVAHQIGNAAKHFTQTVSRLFATGQQNVSEYIKEEFRMSPTPIEMESFLDDLDDLKSDVNRLEARIKKLKTTIDN